MTPEQTAQLRQAVTGTIAVLTALAAGYIAGGALGSAFNRRRR